jgi:hypothetical protein
MKDQHYRLTNGCKIITYCICDEKTILILNRAYATNGSVLRWIAYEQ